MEKTTGQILKSSCSFNENVLFFFLKTLFFSEKNLSLIHILRGAKFIPSFDDVTLLVDIYAEKSVEVPIRGINFPPDKVLRTFPSKVQVTFQVGLSHFKSITCLLYTS